MIKKISFFQLSASLTQLKDKSCPHALLVGNDPYLIELSLQQLKQIKRKQSVDSFFEQVDQEITAQTDWQTLLNAFYSTGLFETEKLFILRFNQATINALVQKNLTQLVQKAMTSSSCTLIFIFNQNSKSIEQAACFQKLTPLWLIPCSIFDAGQLKQWLSQKLTQLNLNVEQAVIERLLYYYEGNLYALDQLLTQMALLYPNRTLLTFAELETLLEDVAQFSPYHWIDAILAQQPKRAIHVLQQLQKEEIEPLILVRVYQKELLQWIDLKKASSRLDLNTLFNEYKIWQNRRPLLTHFLSSTSLALLYERLFELKKIEIDLKTYQTNDIWLDLARLTLSH